MIAPANKSLEQMLLDKGHDVIRPLGKGMTGRTFQTKFGERLQTVKIEHPNIDNDSVATVVNTARHELFDDEVDTGLTLSHPNIVKPVGRLVLEDGSRVVVSDYIDGVTLQEAIGVSGPMDNFEAYRKVARQAAVAIDYLHGEGVVHRDLKPSNAIFNKQNLTLIDLQNAARIEGVQEKLLPTRGGTEYTHPRLLAGFAQDKKTRYEKSDDYFALGAMLYFMSTGEHLSDYRVAFDDEGTEVEGLDRPISLFKDDEKIEFDAETFAKETRQKLKNVDKRRRKVIEKLLSGYTSSATDVIDAGYFGFGEKVKQKIRDGSRYLIPGIAVGVCTGALTVFGIHEYYKRPAPTVESLMQPDDEFLQSSSILDNDHVTRYLAEEINAIDDIVAAQPESFDWYVDRGVERSGLSPQLISAWYRVAHTQENMGVPQEFYDAMEDQINSGHALTQRTDDFDIGLLYLQQCVYSNETPHHALVRYFVDDEDFYRARATEGTADIFYSTDLRGGSILSGVEGSDNAMQAIALYAFTDTQGEVDLSTVPEVEVQAHHGARMIGYTVNLEYPE